MRDEPGPGLAIVGIGCRFPGGADGPERFWKLLCEGFDAITEIPRDRFDVDPLFDPDPAAPGKLYTRRGGFVDGIAEFDADFFGIAPREARRVDPQQRLLLEVVWEALEEGGIPPDRLAGTRTGVFVGISSHDYTDVQVLPYNRHRIDAHINAGGASCIAANRVSYLLDLRGPSLAVDTACSSSLTAVHLACRSLASGECDLAIVGGVNVLLSPEVSIGFCKATMLSPDGRCHAFDARANGYVRGEGAGAVVLKPLARALADGDPIHAVIRGSSINQDGRTPGLSLPSADGQGEMLRAALRSAGVAPAAVQYVEAHGTGTSVGDPIEAAAIGRVFSAGRSPGEYCLIGSVKTNIGHLEAGAGIAGLIKASLALRHRVIPPSLHFSTPNPSIAFEELRLRVPTELEPWPASAGPAMAGVNSFGFGGANAHVVLEEPPVAAGSDGAGETATDHVLTLSARTPEALREVATRHARLLQREAPPRLGDVCYTASVRRSHHEQRLAVVGSSPGEMIEALTAFGTDDRRANLARGRASRNRPPKLAFVFPGMGVQWWGMGRELLAEEEVFRSALREVDRLLQPLAGWSLLAELAREEADSRITEPYLAHVANFGIQFGLTALWRSWGIVPDAVVGHSSGEMAAACVAGALGLPDAVRLAFHRGRLQQRTSGTGRMLAAGIPEEAVARWIGAFGDRISLAAVNGPSSVTLSGEAGALERIAAELEGEGRFCRFLSVDVPYHGPQMEPIREELLRELRDLSPGPVGIPLVSEVTGEFAEGPELDAAYWWRNVREPVRFAAAVDRLAETGCEIFVEVGPHPVLAGAIGECVAQRGRTASVLPSLRRGEVERRTMLRSLAALHVHGRRVEWSKIYPAGVCVPLPSYPWQRERHWFETEESAAVAPSPGADSGHPLLGRRLRSPQPLWETGLSDARLQYLQDHRVQESVVFPAAGYVEMALAAARALELPTPLTLERLEFERLLFLGPAGGSILQLAYDSRTRAIHIHSTTGAEHAPWTLHASAVIGTAAPAGAECVDLRELRDRCEPVVEPDAVYRSFARQGLSYGSAFRGIREAWRGKDEAFGRLALDPPLSQGTEVYRAHPALLDAAFQLLGSAAADGTITAEGPVVPVSIARLEFQEDPGPACWAHAVITRRQAGALEGEVRLLDDSGRVLLHCRGLRLRALAETRGREALSDWLYHIHWEHAPLRAGLAHAERLRAPEHIAAEVRSAPIPAVWTALQRHYEVAEPALQRIAVHHIREAMRELGAPDGCDSEDPLALADRLGVVENHRRLFTRLLELLRAEHGGEDEHPHGGVPPTRLAEAVLADHPEHGTEFELLERCGSRLAQVLRGQLDARDLLFGDSFQALSRLYRSSPVSTYYNELAARAVAAAVGNPAPGAPLRVLEIGAGTGGLTSAVLPSLAPGMTDYLFSDLSQYFLTRAKEEFRGREGLRFAVLDLETSPDSQGQAPGSFDLLLGANVVHATADIRATLRHLRRLLAPGGLLILIEITRRAPWLDLIFGLLEGWWRFGDHQLRPAHPLLLQEQWPPLLREAGFGEVEVLADSPRAGGTMESLLIARVPAVTDGEGTEPVTARRRWLVLSDRHGTGSALGAALRERGDECILVQRTDTGRTDPGALQPHADLAGSPAEALEISAGSSEDLRRLLEDVTADGAGLDGVIHLWSLDAPSPEETGTAAVMEAQDVVCGSVLDLIHALQRTGTSPGAVWLVTSGAQAVADDPVDGLLRAPLWGLGRVLRNEQPALRPSLVDLSAPPAPEEIAALIAELDTEEFTPEICLRGSRRWVGTLGRAAPTTDRGDERTVRISPDTGSFTLEPGSSGTLDAIGLRGAERRSPGRGQVRIRVLAAGLNFRDVMLALGLLPPAVGGSEAGTHSIECAGIVTECGEDVESLRPGDEVIALAVGALGSHAIARQELVVRKPAHLSFEEAASIGGAYLTAHYSLIDLAKLGAGERVLIHAATGGVGHAAVQLCRRLGVEIFATAGTAEKREYLRSLGLEHVMDSRSLTWADEVLQRTAGEGVDVVLNSLAGEAIPKGLEVLRPFGRFVEIGKRDIYEDATVGLLPFRKNIAFFSVDLVRLCDERPEIAGALLREIVGRVKSGELEPPPHTLFDVAEAEQAYRLMAQARHIGKVVLTLREPEYSVRPASEGSLFRGDATYLITGGLGGFGLAVAEWMAHQGARHLVLMTRSGVAKDNEQALLRLQRAGALVHVATGDAGSEEDVARTLAAIRAESPPLRGVLHLAMVLDDALLGELDHERFRTVMHPKIAGAWNLHRMTTEDPLDHFVLFSSITSVVGHPQQANYAAANTFLDSLAAYRRARGLPGVSISWGTVAEVGYVSRHAAIQQHLARLGIESFSPTEALAALDHALRQPRPHLVAARLEWDLLRKWSRLGRGTEEDRPQLVETGAAESAPGPADLLRRLRELPSAEVPLALEAHVLSRVARVLGATPERIDPERPLTEMGLDSLLAVELIAALRLDLGVQIPVVKLLQGTSSRDVVALLVDQLELSASPASVVTEAAEESSGTSLVPATAVHTESAPAAPLSFEQRRFWYLDQLSPGNPAYNLFAAARLSGRLDTAALQAAFDEVVRRHDVLRASFLAVDGVPQRTVDPAAIAALSLRDLSHLPPDEREPELQRIATSAIRLPFDLARPPLARGVLVRLDDEEHAFVLLAHHIACDAWGMTLLVRELMILYGTFRRHAPSPLPEPTGRYADYVRLQRESLTDQLARTQLDYWRRALAGAPPPLELPTDRPRPEVPTFSGGRVPFELSSALSEALREMGRREGVTLFAILLAAFQGLLSRYSGAADVSVGTPVSTRLLPGTEDLVGCCMNTLVLRADLSDDPRLTDLLHRASSVSLEALANQDLPFEQVVEALRPLRDGSHSPLFRAMLILHNLRWPELDMEGLRVQPMEVESGASALDLTLLIDTGERLRGSLEYSADLFEPQTAARMLAHFQMILEAMVADPLQRLSTVPLLTPEERTLVLSRWSGGAVDLGEPVCVHRLIEARAEEVPEAPAVVFAGQRLSYGELDDQATRLAAQLQRTDVKPGSIVGICLTRSPDLVVSIVAALKAGAAFLPLDPRDPEQRRYLMVENAGARVLVTERRLFPGLANGTSGVVLLEPGSGRGAGERVPTIESEVTPDDLAYVIHTSGSTGEPKAVAVPHGALWNQLRWRQLRFPLEIGEPVLQRTPIGFDPAVWELLGPLSAGACVVLPHPGCEQDPLCLTRLIAEESVTTLQVVPSVLSVLLDTPELARCRSLRRVLCGGERLTRALQQRFFATLAGVELHNLYGPAEATIDSTCWTCRSDDERPSAPIGRPIANARVLILDSQLNPVPVGLPGELYVGGAGLARGYLDRPRLTAERFVPDPHAGPETRLYRTGDLGRWLPNGDIEFLGRTDTQVKVRGHRVELTEVELAIRDHAGVLEALVAALEEPEDGVRLVARVVPDPEHPVAPEELRASLVARLPAFMVPAEITLVDALPRLPSGKLNRRAAASSARGGPEAGRAPVPPRDAVELRLTRIWEQLFATSAVGVTDDFFALGGHSLLAMRLMARVRAEFERELSVGSLVQDRTIARLARRLRGEPAGRSEPAIVPLQPDGSRTPLYFVHPTSGTVLCYLELAKCLGPDQPCYGIQAPGLGLDETPLARIEELAAHHVQALRAVQPHGPYRLGGWSMGGLIAFEMARQLDAQGAEIATLALLDAWPARRHASDEDDSRVFELFVRSLGLEPERIGDLQDLWRLGPEAQLAGLLGHPRATSALPHDIDPAALRRRLDVFKAHLRALREYVPGPFPGRLILFQATDSSGSRTEPQANPWAELARGGVTVHPIPGDHYSLMREPALRHVAQRLAGLLHEIPVGPA